ncbi:MAG: hypothetical protein OXI34_11850 [Chloroflexota bacterium]|nr:hypothetical protein [Chloroflexota bacterium]MDE2946032.1 hypothetical protein [Chloroflexota bacterium]
MTADVKPQNLIEVDDRSPMESLPYWARATNPIVRRHLGLYWRTLPPEFEPIFYTCAFWVMALLTGLVFPFVIDLATTVIVVSVLVIPVGIIFYIRALFSIAANSAAAMADEIRHNTMQLLMSTPMSLEQIFFGKVASAIWRKMDDLILIVQSAAIFGPPLIIMHYAGLFPLRESGPLTTILIIIMSITALLRLVLEPLMFGMVGVGIGAFVPFRAIAMTSAVAWVAFYFLLINMLQQLNLQYLSAALDGAREASELLAQAANTRLALAIGLTMLIELVLPLALPYALIRGVSGLLARQLRAG